MEGSNNIETKTIEYKGKIKIIPAHNTDSKLCEHFLIAKMRYCKFDKFKDSIYCVYHTTTDEFVICPYDPSHRILKDHYKKHIKVCNILSERNRIKENPWYEKDINRVNSSKMSEDELNNLHMSKYIVFNF